MTTLSELDRPVQEFHVARWDRALRYRALSAAELVRMQTTFADAQGVDTDTARAVDFFAELLALCAVDPTGTAQEWLAECTIPTLIELGTEVANYNGLLLEEKKSAVSGP